MTPDEILAAFRLYEGMTDVPQDLDAKIRKDRRNYWIAAIALIVIIAVIDHAWASFILESR